MGQQWCGALGKHGAVWGGDWGNSLLGYLSTNTFHGDAVVAGAKEQLGGTPGRVKVPCASGGARSGVRAGQDLGEVRLNPCNAKKGVNWLRLWVRRAGLNTEDQYSSHRRVGVPHSPQNARAGGCYVPITLWEQGQVPHCGRQQGWTQLWE